MSYISLRGGREHNLKNINLNIPRDKLIVITGVSGSGKTTLAFDILFAEGQRRYIESLPAYVRQYIQVLAKPDIDMLKGIPPTVAISQRTSLFTRRSTVATITEIGHYLRLFYAKAGKSYCPQCGRAVQGMNETEILESILNRWQEKEIVILAPKVIRKKGWHKEIFKEAIKKGYEKVRVDGKIISLPEIPTLSRYQEHSIEFIIGKIKPKSNKISKLQKIINLALREGKGIIIVTDKENEQIYSEKLFCPFCQIGLPNPDPRLFSFNSVLGACPTCDGLGVVNGHICYRCQGTRLNQLALSVKVDNYNIAEIQKKSVDELIYTLNHLSLDEKQKALAKIIFPEIITRLKFLKEVGLGYLTLDRSGDSLSGGEAQRLRLAAQLGSNLRGVCYILDEPTIGLHPRDNELLLKVLRSLQKRGNTVIVVEHDTATIEKADIVIDLGPGAGKKGGEVIAIGSPKEIIKNPFSITGQYLKRPITLYPTQELKDKNWLIIKEAKAFNLKNIDVKIPLATLTCVTGVSGSGKSSLVMEVIYKGLKARLRKKNPPDNHKEMIGWERLNRVLVVDHSPIGRTPRSTPATYVGVWDEIRRLFAHLPEARARGYTPSRFSFNVPGGRCEHCGGHGKIKVEMSFLPEVYVDCEICNGNRFNEETLSITYKGKNIAEILKMTIAEAAEFFSAIPHIVKPLKILKEIGLDYLTLGQPSHTLSGGEAQRLKLATELWKTSQGKTLYLLDEPSTGLHRADIEKLIKVFKKLVEAGNTIIVIEHNLDIIAAADYIIDLGPEGGEKGGYLVASGTPLEIMKCKNSYTGKWLKRAVDIVSLNKTKP
ncbi:MAG: excinuclease ABC subunit UvrA [Candidatus Desulfofervidus auxilii]|nr:excinuclease ABC subunit UvrA [Candidatus Desulfofervidus auxilii]